jgi:Flp pilus assembly protein TadD
MSASLKLIAVLLSANLIASAQSPAPAAPAQTPGTTTSAPQAPPQQPEFVSQGQQLIREGKIDEAIARYRKTQEASPNSLAANNALGVALDLKGQGDAARKYFALAIELAPNAQARASATRAVAMSYAFEGNCKKAIEQEQKVLDYYAQQQDYFQQGEVADEAARVCIDAGDLDAASKWYQMGHDLGLREPDIKADRKDLWDFRLEHALARIAARRGNKAEAEKHVAVAKAILDRGTNPQQAQFLPYLSGYVAFYGGDYKGALDHLQKANQNDPFIQCLMAQSYEKLGDKEKATEYYRKAAATTSHNPPAAYAQPFAKRKLS